ncbi:hypothetical protein [Caballeronia grimmiae]|uniref:hypothetical protein n=1 Tax=Caballeronia grimmiae TaxID=1071679 RepID=UPI0038BB60CD
MNADSAGLLVKRRTLLRLASLAASLALPSHGLSAQTLGECPALASGPRRMSDLIGSNGWAGSPSDICMWKEMGISWGRNSVGPGQPNSPDDMMNVSKTSSAFDVDLAGAILRNNQNGIRSLLYLGFTPKWNATVAGDSKSAPKDVRVWQRYVDAAVSTYSKPPYNVRYFQVWNEAAGRLSGGSPQATFWHGPGYDKTRMLFSDYERAMQDYVDLIHLPAASIIRRYQCNVVYGGWPDQGGLDTFVKWLEFQSSTYHTRIIDHVDYLDTHYLNINDLSSLYQRYVKPGKVKGLWQTEIGDRYMEDPHYLPNYFFDFAEWALKHSWDDPNQYVSMIYHWDGYEPFRLTRRGPPRTFNVSGRSLSVLCKTVPGRLSMFSGSLSPSDGTRASALYSDDDLIVKVTSPPGRAHVRVHGFKGAAGSAVSVIDAITGATSPANVQKVGPRQVDVSFDTQTTINGRYDNLSYLVLKRGP